MADNPFDRLDIAGSAADKNPFDALDGADDNAVREQVESDPSLKAITSQFARSRLTDMADMARNVPSLDSVGTLDERQRSRFIGGELKVAQEGVDRANAAHESIMDRRDNGNIGLAQEARFEAEKRLERAKRLDEDNRAGVKRTITPQDVTALDRTIDDQNRKVEYYQNLVDQAQLDPTFVPDGQSLDDWRANLKAERQTLNKLTVAREGGQQVPAVNDPSGFGEFGRALKTGVAGTVPEMIGGALRQFGDSRKDPALTDIGTVLRDFGRGVRRDTPAQSAPELLKLGEKNAFGSDLKNYLAAKLGEGIGTSLPIIAGYMAGGPVAAVGGSGAMGVGQMRNALEEAFAEEGTPFPSDKAEFYVYTYGTAIGALESLTEVWGMSSLTGEAKKHAARSLAKAVARGVASGALMEGITEGLQELVEIHGVSQVTGKAIDWPEARRRMIESTAAGAIPGTAFGAVTAVGERKHAFDLALTKAKELGFNEPPKQPEAQPTPAESPQEAAGGPIVTPAASAPQDAQSQPTASPEALAPEAAAVLDAVDAILPDGIRIDRQTVADTISSVQQAISPESAAQSVAEPAPAAPAVEPQAAIKSYLDEGGSLRRDALPDLAKRVGVLETELPTLLDKAVEAGMLRKTAGGMYRRAPAAPTAEPAVIKAGKKRAEIASAIDEALAFGRKIAPKGTQIATFSEEYRANTGQLVDAMTADGSIALATYAINPKGRMAHEVGHELVRRGQMSPQEMALLAERAEKVAVFDDARRQQYREAYRARYSQAHLERILDEEAAMHLIEARVNGSDFGPQINAIIDRVLQALERIANALRGKGYQTADDVIAAVTSGEMAQRDPVQEWMRAEDVTAVAFRQTEQKQPAAAPAPSRRGKVTTPDGSMSLDVEFKVIDAAALQAASGDLQPRDRATRAASATQIQTIAARLNPDLLTFSPQSDRGAPIVDKAGVVLSGNGRVAAIDAARRMNAPGYRAYLERLRQEGFAIEGMQRPVLVREIAQIDDAARREFAIKSNQDDKLAMSPSEQARADRDMITPDALALLDPEAEAGLLAASNRPFVRAMLDKMSAGQRGGLLSERGDLTPAGAARLEGGIFAAAYGDAALVTKFVEDQETVGVRKALLGAAPSWAQMRAVAPSEFDITRNLIDAVNAVAEMRDKKLKPAEYFAQQDAFARAEPLTEQIALAFYNDAGTRAARWQRTRDVIKGYSRVAMDQGNAVGDLLGDTITPSAILESQLRTAAIEDQPVLFAMRDGDDAAQKAKAEAAGFDTRKVWYHGTRYQFDAFDPAAVLAKRAEHDPFYAASPRMVFLSADEALPTLFNGGKDGRTIRTYVKRDLNVFDGKADGDKLAAFLVEHEAAIRDRLTGPEDVPLIDQVRAGKWAVMETPPVQEWLRSNGYDGFKAEQKGFSGTGSTSEILAIFDSANSRGAIRDTAAKFDPAKADSPNLMFAFAGERAKTADLDALAKAKEMDASGAPREAIWDATGWFRGVDGKWRFEIDDASLKAVVGDGGVSHEALAAAYPEMRYFSDVSVGKTPVGGFMTNAGQVGGQPYSSISVRGPADQLRSIAGHELQHGVQIKEKFAQGANYDSAKLVPEYAAAMEAYNNLPPDNGWTSVNPHTPETIADGIYRRFAGEAEARLVQKRMDLTAEERRARPPWLDYDVPEEQQIVRGASEPMFAMVDRNVGQEMRRDLDQLGYFSGALEAAKRLKQAKGTPEQMLAMLKKHGVKQAEIEATGLDKFLQGKAGSSASTAPGGDGAFTLSSARYKAAEAAYVKAFGDDIESNKHKYFDDWRDDPDNPITADDWGNQTGGAEISDAMSDASPHGERAFKQIPATAAALEAAAASLGLDLALVPSVTSASRYGTITVDGVKKKVRIADHERQSVLHDGADFNVAPGSMTPVEFIERMVELAPPSGERISGKADSQGGLKQNLVTRDEIVGHLEQNRLGLNENVYGPKVLPTQQEAMGNQRMDLYMQWQEGKLDTETFQRMDRDIESKQFPREPQPKTKWSSHSLDPSNPTYRETVLHLPDNRIDVQGRAAAAEKRIAELDALDGNLTPEQRAEYSRLRNGDVDRENFRSGHFSEPNIVGHMMTSMTKLPGRNLNRAEYADIEAKVHAAGSTKAAYESGAISKDDAHAYASRYGDNQFASNVFTLDQIQSDWGQKLRDGGVRDEAKIKDLHAKMLNAKDRWEEAKIEFPKNDPQQRARPAQLEYERIRAELATAEQSPVGHPLVNTTDQWTNTTLRRAVRQAAEADAAYIAVPTGDTVLSYNPGDTAGMHGFYGSATQEGIVPKNLRKLLLNIDKDTPKPVKIDKLETPTSGMKGEGFTLFPLTDKVKAAVKEQGQPLFAMRSEPEIRQAMRATAARGVELPDGTKVNGVLLFAIRAYHGSPHDFDKFDMSKIGTGEGAQAYGHGLYFAENEKVAKLYRDNLKDGMNVVRDPSGKPLDNASMYNADPGSLALRSLRESGDFETARSRLTRERDNVAAWRKDTSKHDEALAELNRLQSEGYKSEANPGRMYEVNINAEPEHFLDWDKPLSQQSEKVRGAIETTLGWKPPASAVTDVELAALEQQSHAARKAYDDMRKTYFEDAWKNPDKSESRFNALPEAYRLQSDILKSHDAINDVLRAREMETGKGIVQKYIDYRGSGKTQGAASENVSRQLRDAGIPGIRYLDQGSRGAGEGSYNYVVFDDKLIEIKTKDGKPVSNEPQFAMRMPWSKPDAMAGLNTIVRDLARDLGIVVRQGLNTPAAKDAKRKAKRAGVDLTSYFDPATGVLRVRSMSDLSAVLSAAGEAVISRFDSKGQGPGKAFNPLETLLAKHAAGLLGQAGRAALWKTNPTYSGVELMPTEREALAAYMLAAHNERLAASTRTTDQARAKRAERDMLNAARTVARIGTRKLDNAIATMPMFDPVPLSIDDVRDYVDVRHNPASLVTAPILPAPSFEDQRAAFGQWFKSYLLDPQSAERQDAALYSAFEDLIDTNDPTLMAKLDSTQEAIAAYGKADPVAIMQSMQVSPARIKATAKMWHEIDRDGFLPTIADRLRQFYIATWDKTHPFYMAVRSLLEINQINSGQRLDINAVDNAYKLLRLAPSSHAWAGRDLEDGIRPRNSSKGEGPSLVGALKAALGDDRAAALETGPGSKYAKFTAYLISRRAVKLWDQFEAGMLERPPIGASRAVALSTVQTLESEQPQFMIASEQVYGFQRNLLTLQRDAGLLTEDLYQTLMADSDYVPFLRDMSDQKAGKGKALGTAQSIIKKFRGSERDILDPVAMIAQKVYETRHLIAINDAKVALLKLAESAGPGAGRIAERLDPQQSQAMRVDLRAGLRAKAREMGIHNSDAIALVQLAQQLLGDDMTTNVFTKKQMQAGAQPITWAYEKGVPVPIRLADGDLGRMMFETLESFGETHKNLLIDMMAVPTQLLRATITSNPAFILRNMWVDGLMAYMYERTATPWVTQVKGFANAIRETDEVKEYAANAGLMGGASTNALEKLRLDRDVRALVERGYNPKLWESPKSWLDGMSTALTGHSKTGRLVFGASVGAGAFIAGPYGAAVGAAVGAAFNKTGRRTIATTSEASETGTRARLYTIAKDRAKANGLNDVEAAYEAAFFAHDYIDYSRSGSRVQPVMRIIAFFNAAMQGLDRYYRLMAAKGDFGSAWAPYLDYRMGQSKVGAVGAAPVLVGKAAMAAVLGGDIVTEADAPTLTAREREELAQSAHAWFVSVMVMGGMSLLITALFGDDERLKEVPEELRATHWVIPLDGLMHLVPKELPGVREALRGQMLRLPKAFETAWMANLVERIMLEARQNNPRWFENYVRDLKNTMQPPMEAQALQLFYELRTGTSMFTGRDIVPTWKAERLREGQWDEYTSEFAKWMGKKADISPYYIDHTLKGLGSSWARDMLSLNVPGTPWYKDNKPDKSLDDYVIARRFLWKAGKGADSAQKVREIMGAEEPLEPIFKRLSAPYSKLDASAATYKDYIKRRDPASASDLLDRLSPAERGFAIMAENLSGDAAKYKMVHPMQRADKVLREVSSLQKEILADLVESKKKPGKLGEIIKLNPSEKAAARDILIQYQMMEAHNALVLTGETGWASRAYFDSASVLKELQAAVPSVSEEFERRMKKANILPFENVKQTWPALKKTIEADEFAALAKSGEKREIAGRIRSLYGETR